MAVYDGGSNAATKIGQYCGQSIPPSRIFSSHEAFIHFVTDGYTPSSPETGFKLEYYPIGRFFNSSLAHRAF